MTTVSWTVDNNSATPIRGTDLGLVFGVSGVEVAAGGSRSGSETMVGPARATRIDNEFYGLTEVDGATLPFYAYAVVDVAACVASGPTTTAGGDVVVGPAFDDACAGGVGVDGRGGVRREW